MRKNNYDDNDIVRVSIEKADAVKLMKKEKPKKGSKSIKPLTITPTDEDTPIKTAIVNQINSRNLTYDDLKEYCFNLKGNQEEGIRLCYNIISGLRYRPSMMDSTVSILMDFLNVDMLLVPRNEDSITAASYNLIQRLKQEPERLYETLEFIRSEVEKFDESGEDESDYTPDEEDE